MHAIQDHYSLKPLSAYGKPYSAPKGKVDPNINTKMAPREQVNHMAAATYFKLLATLMKKNPPAAADLPIVGKMAKIGIIPGRDFDPGQLDPAVAKALEPAAKSGLEQILAETQRVGKRVNGWQMSFAGKYGDGPSISGGNSVHGTRRESAAGCNLSTDPDRWQRAAVERRQ